MVRQHCSANPMPRLAIVLILTSLLSAAPKKAPLPAQYSHWLNTEVTYIISDEEKKAFLTLETDSERDRFIDEFWDIRNPRRGGATNAYKEEHYGRLQYANDTFGRRSNTPGWQTDMGRAWILFGKPVSRAPYLGYGQLYPLELWTYSNQAGDPSLPGFFNLLFFMPEDIGEYRFYRPSLDTPLKLVRGSQFNSNSDVYKFLKPIAGDLAHAAFSLVSGDPIDTTSFTVDMSSDMLISKIQNLANDHFNLQRLRELRSLRIQVNSTFLTNQDQPLVIHSLIIPDPIGQFWLDFSIPIRDQSLGKVTETKQLSVQSAFRLLTESGELIAENDEQRTYPAFAPDGSFHPFQLASRLPVLPGNYKLEFRIVDREKSRVFRGEQKVSVGAPAAVSLEGPLLFSSANRVAQPDGLTPFQYFGVQFQPAANPSIPRSESLHLLYSLQLPPGQVQDCTVEYLVAHAQEHDSRVTVKDTIPAGTFRNGRLIQSKTIPLAGLIPGPYVIVVSVRSATGSAVLASSSTPARLGDEVETAPLYFLESARKTASPAGSSYIRALEAISWKDEPAALRYMKLALDADPGNAFASRYLVEKWFEAHQFTPVVSLYRKLGMKPFESSAESLAQISLSFARTGDRREAQAILTSARAIFPDNPLLLAVMNAVSK
jgi:GWxTD domain-containing protein